ncbi:hypothetical protein ACP275_12G105300 [Erythranthe tilingii]
MAVNLNPSLTRSPASTFSLSTRLCSPVNCHFGKSQGRLFSPLIPSLKLPATNTRISQDRHFSPLIPANSKLRVASTRRPSTIYCFKNSATEESIQKDKGFSLQVLKRWDVPWNWQTISLTSLACGFSFVLTGLIEAAAIQYSGINIQELSLDGTAEILFLTQGIATAVVLTVLLSLTKSFSPLPDDIYQYDWREPFDLKKGWLLWAGIGLGGALAAVAVTGAAMSFFSFNPERKTDSLMMLLPLIGSSTISTACLVGVTGVLAPVLEETVFRGFFMVSLTKWLPTPLSVLLSAAVFALAHLTPGGFPQLFVLGIVLGFSYSQTRNLLTPITIHAFWNTGVIILLTFLQLNGYDIKEMLQSQ